MATRTKSTATRKKSTTRKKTTAKKTSARKKTSTRKKTSARKKTSTRKKSAASRRKYSPAASESVREEMHEYKRGAARSGRKGGKVKSRKQAIAIGLSEARAAGKKVPSNPSRGAGKKKS